MGTSRKRETPTETGKTSRQARQAAPSVVLVNGRPFSWTPEDGLDLEAVGALHNYIRMVAWQVLRNGACPECCLDDLIQEGVMAALGAARRYDPTRGANFLTFAQRGVRGAMLEFISNYRLTRKDEEGTSRLLVLQQVLPGGEEDGLDQVEAAEDPDWREAWEAPTRREIHTHLQKALEGLGQSELTLLTLVHGLGGRDPLSLAAAARAMGMTPSLARGLLAEAEERLRGFLIQTGRIAPHWGRRSHRLPASAIHWGNSRSSVFGTGHRVGAST